MLSMRVLNASQIKFLALEMEALNWSSKIVTRPHRMRSTFEEAKHGIYTFESILRLKCQISVK
jgi:hypothetical protein